MAEPTAIQRTAMQFPEEQRPVFYRFTKAILESPDTRDSFAAMFVGQGWSLADALMLAETACADGLRELATCLSVS